MKIIHLNYSDANGGAHRAAYRIHRALLDSGVYSTMWVNVAATDDWTVEGPVGKWGKAITRVRSQAGGALTKTIQTENSSIHSPAIFPSSWVKLVNASDADVVHLHWVQDEMLSISDIGRIEKPIVWTLHDMWAFCGAEHYTEDFRWREGYRRDNRPAYESGFDLNRWTWERKRKHWEKPIHIVGDSNWLTQCAAESALMRDWSSEFIYYPLDLDVWQPLKKSEARDLLSLPLDVPLLAFGALGGGRDPRKGFDLLVAALANLRGEMVGMELVIFGQLKPRNQPDLGFPIHYTGHLHDDLSLRVLYSAVDGLVVPSRQEAFGQTASEAHACGTPVISFDIGGLPDTVTHKKTGYLARPFCIDDLSEGIRWVLKNGEKEKMSRSARAHAEKFFHPRLIARQYIDVYKNVLSK